MLYAQGSCITNIYRCLPARRASRFARRRGIISASHFTLHARAILLAAHAIITRAMTPALRAALPFHVNTPATIDTYYFHAYAPRTSAGVIGRHYWAIFTARR